MQFIYKDKKGEEQGPFDQEAMEKWAELGKIGPQTQVRNAILHKWKPAEKLEFLHGRFALPDEEEDTEAWWGEKFGFARKTKKSSVSENTAFKYEYKPNPAPAKLRFLAGLTDAFIIGIVALVLFFSGAFAINSYDKANNIQYYLEAAEGTEEVGGNIENPVETSETETQSDTISEENKEEIAKTTVPGAHLSDDVLFKRTKKLNNIFYNRFIILTIITLLYLGISLGVFAQTVGMWYYGLMIAKPDASEVFLARAYAFSIVTIFLGVLSPIMALVNPMKISINEILTGTRIIRISAKPKA